MKRNKTTGLQNVKILTVCAMLVALGVVIGIVCKTFFNFGGGAFRITFENLPIIMSGILFGPLVGGLVAAAVDLISALMAGQAPLPFVLVGSISVGVVSGLVSKFIVKKKGSLQIICSEAAAHLFGSMIIKTMALFPIYFPMFGWLTLLRIPIYLVIAPIEIMLICLLFKNRAFAKLIGYTEV